MKKWIFLFLLLAASFIIPVIFTTSKNASLIIQAISVLVSSIIAISAIWGEHIRSSFAGPKLILHLKNNTGDLTRVTNGPGARYYHLKVTNKRSAAIARNTRVQIISIQRTKEGIWSSKQETYGIEPKWVFSDPAPKNIAYDALCDIVSVYETGDCWISSYIYPNNVDLQIKSGQLLRLEIVAVAENAKSNLLALEIFWDGQWSLDSQEMKNHLKIREV